VKYFLKDRYIMTSSPGGFDQIVGRVIGGEGSASYQLAARPYDELMVNGYDSIEAAYRAAVAVLEERDAS
jgi:hypothetical protein